MALADRLAALATRIATEFKLVRSELDGLAPADHTHPGMARIETVLDFADITSPEPGVLYIKVEP